MANPSLQIGNSNWAIKEDNLLGYSTAGTRFLPQPITMTRASAGTRVNSSGLVETVELLGSEKITNGSFVLPNSTWNITNNTGTNTRIENNHLIIETDGTFTQVTELNVLEIGKNYKLVYDVTATDGGNLGLETGGATSLIPSTIGTHTFYWVSNSTTFNLKRYSGALNITIDNVSVKESTKNNLARVDYDGTASSLLVEPERTNTLLYSEDFSQYSYGGTAPTLTTGQLAPDGTYNATKVSGVLNSTSLYRASESSTTASRSIYARTVSGTGTVNLMSYGSNTNNNFTITEEWQRFELTGSSATGGTNFYAVDFRFPSSNPLTELIIWGGQSEEATYPTSYIPTSGSTVTRVKDQYSKTGISNLINSEEGVLFLEVAAFITTSPVGFISLNDGGVNNKAAFYYNSVLNKIIFEYVVGGATQASFTYTK